MIQNDYPDSNSPRSRLALEQRLKQLEAAIAEARLRLPAHSIKPALMAALLDLEDEREDHLKQLKAIQKRK